MNEGAVGIDVSKKKLDVCVATGDKIKAKVFKNTAAGHAEFNRWLSQRELPADAPIVLEATGPTAKRWLLSYARRAGRSAWSVPLG